MHIPQTLIRFPEIKLQTRDAHKLRGYFGNLFKEKSELLHNHLEEGELRYAYPQVQYKVIGSMPVLVGVLDGARLLNELFLKIRELNIDGRVYPVLQKNIESGNAEIGVNETLNRYRFETWWMALNQQNFTKYAQMSPMDAKNLLERTLVGNCLSFFKNMNLFIEERITVNGVFFEKSTRFKNNRMIVFSGEFETNAVLPDFVGLGKQVARGFGTIKRTG